MCNYLFLYCFFIFLIIVLQVVESFDNCVGLDMVVLCSGYIVNPFSAGTMFIRQNLTLRF